MGGQQSSSASAENAGGPAAEGTNTAPSLPNPPVAPHTPEAEAARRKLKDACANLRCALWPVIALVFVWTLYLSPSSLPSCLPVLWKPPGKETSVEKIMPIHPKNLRQSFQFGKLSAKCFMGICPSAALHQAAKIAGRDTVSSKELLAIETLVEELDSKMSLMDSLSGVMSFINVVWFFSIAGIVCTAIPVMHMLFGRMLLKFAMQLGRILFSSFRPLLMWLATDLPVLLHTYGFLEAALYAACLSLINTAAAYPIEHASSARMIALTGAFGLLPALFYSGGLHEPPFFESKEVESVFLLCYGFAALELIPLALCLDSALMGFFAVSFFYQTLGFSAYCFGQGFAVGFSSLETLERCCITSKIMLVTYSTLLVSGFTKAHIVKPFALGIMVWGSIVYFLALLIISSRWHCKGFGTKYNMRNLLMVASITLYSFLGFVWHAQAMSNTAITFFVLWLMEKQFEGLGTGVLSLFLGCVTLFWSSHELSTRPDFLMKMIDAQGVLL